MPGGRHGQGGLNRCGSGCQIQERMQKEMEEAWTTYM